MSPEFKMNVIQFQMMYCVNLNYEQSFIQSHFVKNLSKYFAKTIFNIFRG